MNEAELHECDASELLDTAVTEGAGSEGFDIARKLLALGLLLAQETLLPEEAAKDADGALFEASTAADVESGKTLPDDGADLVADRFAAATAVMISDWLQQWVEAGLSAAGVVIAGRIGFDPLQGAEMGRMIGVCLRPVIRTVVRAGVEKLSRCVRTWLGGSDLSSPNTEAETIIA